jgi:uncharacterized protein YjlB
MPLLESLKERVEKLAGKARLAAGDIDLHARSPQPFRFADDGITPNNPSLPLLLYRSPVRLAAAADPAEVLEQLFARNGWGDSWRDGVYRHLHYHSRIHEVLGIARGQASVRFGGAKGRLLKLKQGDVVVLPVGTGHQCIEASSDLLVVGAYPHFGTYDECGISREEHDRALATIAAVALPGKDPVYGRDGPLLRLWRKD